MDDTISRSQDLERKIKALREQLAALEDELSDVERPPASQLDAANSAFLSQTLRQKELQDVSAPLTTWTASSTLRPEEYTRYGRQMILPEVGLEGVQSYHQSVLSMWD